MQFILLVDLIVGRMWECENWFCGIMWLFNRFVSFKCQERQWEERQCLKVLMVTFVKEGIRLRGFIQQYNKCLNLHINSVNINLMFWLLCHYSKSFFQLYIHKAVLAGSVMFVLMITKLVLDEHSASWTFIV